jgi:hypothetical protein
MRAMTARAIRAGRGAQIEATRPTAEQFPRAAECKDGCQYAKDVAMPEYQCSGECQYRARLCSRCGGEGNRYSGHPNDPTPTYVGICEACDGTGYEHRPTADPAAQERD